MWFVLLCGSYDKYDCIVVIDPNAEPSLVLLANHKPNQSFSSLPEILHLYNNAKITFGTKYFGLSWYWDWYYYYYYYMLGLKYIYIYLITEEQSIIVVLNDSEESNLSLLQ